MMEWVNEPIDSFGEVLLLLLFGCFVFASLEWRTVLERVRAWWGSRNKD
jgi:hypothetical protein